MARLKYWNQTKEMWDYADGVISSESVKELKMIFKNVTEMKTDTKLKPNMGVMTLGYYEPNDGGAGEYYIRTKTLDDKEDNGNILFLQNNLVAELIIYNNLINVKQYGVKDNLDGVVENILKNKEIRKIYIPRGEYHLTNLTLRGINGLEIYGANSAEAISNGTKIITETPISIYGGNDINIHDISFYCSPTAIIQQCIVFYDDDINSSKCRIGNIHVEDCYIWDYEEGIKLDCPSGYTYFTNLFIKTTKPNSKGINIGEKYANKVSIWTGYTYIDKCKFGDSSVEHNNMISGIEIHESDYVWINDCDLAFATTGCGIKIISDIGNIQGIYINHTSIFNCLKCIEIIKGQNKLKSIDITSNVLYPVTNSTGSITIYSENVNGLNICNNTLYNNSPLDSTSRILKIIHTSYLTLVQALPYNLNSNISYLYEIDRYSLENSTNDFLNSSITKNGGVLFLRPNEQGIIKIGGGPFSCKKLRCLITSYTNLNPSDVTFDYEEYDEATNMKTLKFTYRGGRESYTLNISCFLSKEDYY